MTRQRKPRRSAAVKPVRLPLWIDLPEIQKQRMARMAALDILIKAGWLERRPILFPGVWFKLSQYAECQIDEWKKEQGRENK